MLLVFVDEFKLYIEFEFYNYYINLIFNRYSIIKGEEVMFVIFGVGFCSQEDMYDCIFFVNLLDNVILLIFICKFDGFIIWLECKILYFNRFVFMYMGMQII